MSWKLQYLFDLKGRVAVITGGTGTLGRMHAEVIAEMGGIPVLGDINRKGLETFAKSIASRYKVDCMGAFLDVTKRGSIRSLLSQVLRRFGRIDILINNAAHNPKVRGRQKDGAWSRFEAFELKRWKEDLEVGLTGAFLCSQVLGSEMATHGGGVILNIASELALIAPDQRIYRESGLREERQPVKPVSYSVAKAGLLMLTKYLATYWARKNVRVNSLSPGGVYEGQPARFVRRLCDLIPMGRMAKKDEYKAAVAFLCSDASSYMTGTNLVIDGGRTAW